MATDGSDVSLAAIRSAQTLLPTHTHWELVSVIPERLEPTAAVSGFAGPVIDPEEVDQIESDNIVEADGSMARTARELGPIPVTYTVLTGDPGAALCAHAEEVRADLLVVGTQHSGAVSRAVFGSVAGYVIDHAPCPVLVIPGS